MIFIQQKQFVCVKSIPSLRLGNRKHNSLDKNHITSQNMALYVSLSTFFSPSSGLLIEKIALVQGAPW
jgi:hypothetical protein